MIRKTLPVLLFLISYCVVGLAQSNPTIVASVSLTDQTVAIPITTIVSPTADALYRISVYASVTSGTANFSRTFLGWTDDVGHQGFVFQSPAPSTHCKDTQHFNQNNCAITTIIRAKAGTPVTYRVSPAPFGAQVNYDLFFTVEQLQ